jgi:hypothetical protein
MKYRNTLLGLAAAAVLGLASTSQAAPLLSLNMTLLDATNAPLPNSGGVYTMVPGQSFRVLVSATVTNPEATTAAHTDVNSGDPIPAIKLGIQNLTFNIGSAGPTGNLVPAATPSTTWSLNGTATIANRLAVPAGINFSATNLVDCGVDGRSGSQGGVGDGDLDPAGAGFNNSVLSYDDGTLAGVQGLQNGLLAADKGASNPGDQVNIIRGGFTAQASGSLLIFIGAANYYADALNATDPNKLQAIAFPAANITLPTIQVVVPEPATLGIAGMGIFGLLGARRRRA